MALDRYLIQLYGADRINERTFRTLHREHPYSAVDGAIRWLRLYNVARAKDAPVMVGWTVSLLQRPNLPKLIASGTTESTLDDYPHLTPKSTA